MQNVGSLAHATSSRSVEFMLYNTLTEMEQVQWVYWQRGISSREIRNGLFQVRVIMNWDGTEYTYDFGSEEYVLLEDEANKGWIKPEATLDHLGGIIASFRVGTARRSDIVSGDFPNHSTSALRDLSLDAGDSLTLEIRSRPTPLVAWHSRRLPLRAKNFSTPEPGNQVDQRRIAFAA